mmetsp:Transcript_23140/g.54999  ORF Transcript_23140/g.54999 Transcript_23140/m.54999 type:complete len:386 (-) Transcript_23140:63-1220(-)|eukprot:CAMPEP_0177725866 /NCGR_PEP_ID=MMETSP0484_2-20121128/19475_1 /TAXON_ID=354590 /ORGANISM="Rhodomonas lens, Strain RHODO" /LENGTH=385 /DNA_ID=CAMNT_0019238399 /DNA_START=130 /DNA_END=1287 /DNA_ORIENTATION=+
MSSSLVRHQSESMWTSLYRNPRVWEIVLKVGLSLGVSLLLSKWLLSQMEPLIDPTYKTRKNREKSRKELMKRLGRDFVTDEYEDAIAKDAINPESIDITFEDIGGLADEKKRLRELVVLPFSRPDLFSSGKLLRPPKGVLLYGPPGTGKTMLAKAIARETKAVFLNLNMSTLQDKWFGESQKLVKAVFTFAWKVQPAIVFIDEVDAFLRERKDGQYETSTNMQSEFMALWDGIGTNNNAQVVVVGATNRPWAIDKAILRRMPRHFLIDIPGLDQRREIVRKLLEEEKTEEGLDLTAIAAATEGYSGSDLKELCRAAMLAPVEDLMREEQRTNTKADSFQLRPLATTDILAARSLVTPTGQSAEEYLEKATGMTRDQFARYLSGQS